MPLQHCWHPQSHAPDRCTLFIVQADLDITPLLLNVCSTLSSALYASIVFCPGVARQLCSAAVFDPKAASILGSLQHLWRFCTFQFCFDFKTPQGDGVPNKKLSCAVMWVPWVAGAARSTQRAVSWEQELQTLEGSNEGDDFMPYCIMPHIERLLQVIPYQPSQHANHMMLHNGVIDDMIITQGTQVLPSLCLASSSPQASYWTN